MAALPEAVLRFIKKHALLLPGERVAVACSGGADSVALFRVLVELREPLGLVFSLAHFNHRLRGAESDADEKFVADLAASHRVDFHSGGDDVARQAQAHKQSLETAARDARYEYFDSLIASGKAEKVALAHTMNDQAETVLMRLLRGTGGLGIAGMAVWRDWPAITSAGNSSRPRSVHARGYLRPLLATKRYEIEDYLRSINQKWCEDSSNQELAHLRNRVRHQLLPMLLREYNPQLIESLSHTAELARAEEEYWSAEIARVLPTLLLPGTPTRGGGRKASPLLRTTASENIAVKGLQASRLTKEVPVAVSLESLRQFPLAMQRRIIRGIIESLGEAIDFAHTASVLDLLQASAGHQILLSGSLKATRTFREILFERPEIGQAPDYVHELAVPGEVRVPELQSRFSAKLVSAQHSTSYNRSNGKSLPGSVRVRNWRPGDKARLPHSKRAKKVKEILQEMHLSGRLRQLWPVIEAESEIVWIRNCELEPLTDGVREIRFEEAEDAP